MTASDAGSSYIHGTEPEEQERLGLMNRLINEDCLRELRLRAGDRVLDVGTGLGQHARGMARVVGDHGTVVGVERDPDQFAGAERLAEQAGETGLLDLRRGDAVDLPLAQDEWGTFDVVHARFVLEHVADPRAVVESMSCAARPGGRVVLADDDHDLLRTWPEVPGFQALWQAYARAYDRRGLDPLVGRRLVALLHDAGCRPSRTSQVFYGGCAGTDRFDGLIDNLLGVVAGARGAVLSEDLLDAESFDAAAEALRRWSRRPDAALWYSIAWAEGIRIDDGDDA